MTAFSELLPVHDKSSFFCGVSVLDSYIKERARLDVKRGLCAVHVLAEGKKILGFYTLSPFTMQLQSLPAELSRKYPRNLMLPCWLLGRLAVDNKYKCQRIGETLLMDAETRVLALSKEAGGYCLVVDAINQQVKPFYEKYGFKPVLDDYLRLYLPLASIL